MYHLDFEKLRELLRGGESRTVEFKESSVLSEPDEILREVTAFTNRDGGDVLLGITDDGQLEHASFENLEERLSALTHRIRDKTSPLVEFDPYLYKGTDGEVVDLRVRKRRGIPVAIVRRTSHEIESRRYFIRTDTGVQRIDDHTLEWLFRNRSDPSIREQIRTGLQYRCVDLSPVPGVLLSPAPGFPPSLSTWFSSLTEDMKAHLKAGHGTQIMDFVGQVLPYALLSDMAALYRGSWRIEFTEAHQSLRWRNLDAPTDHWRLKDLELDDSSLLHRLGLTPSRVYQDRDMLSLPAGTRLRIQPPIDFVPNWTLHLDKPQAFWIEIRPDMWSGGSGLVGGPLGRLLDAGETKATARQTGEEYAHITFNIDIRAEVAMPNYQDNFERYLEWVRQIIDWLRRSWDWERKTARLTEELLKSIRIDLFRATGTTHPWGRNPGT